MSEEGLIPDKIIHIKCIDRIIANKQNNGYNQTIAMVHQGIRCVLAPNNCTERNDPCVGLNLAAPMSEEGLIPDKIIHIKCIDRIIANKRNNGYNQTSKQTK
jgi:hypothetical protein